MSGVVSGFPDDFMEYPDARVWCGRTMLPNTRKPGCVLGEIALRAESVLELTLVSDRLSVGVRSTEWGPEELAIFQFARQIAFGLASLSFATGLMVAFLLRKRTGRG